MRILRSTLAAAARRGGPKRSLLKDENGAAVQSEKMLEIQFAGNTPVRNGDQFGLGRVVYQQRATDVNVR